MLRFKERNFILAFWRGAPHSSSMPSALKARFEPVQSKSGKGWCVRVTPPHGRAAQIDGFTRRADAVASVEHEAAEWLKHTKATSTPELAAFFAGRFQVRSA